MPESKALFGYHITKKKMVKVNALAYAAMIKRLVDEPATRKDLAEESGLHYITVLHYIRALHKAKAIRIVGYEIDESGRENAPMFALGAGPDKRRHRRTSAERAKEYRQNKKLRGMTFLTAGMAAE